MKDKALQEIRRRIATALDACTRAKLCVLETAIARDLVIEPVGKVIDVSGDVFGYAFGLFHALPEIVGDPLAYISVTRIENGGVDRFARFAKCANQAFKIGEHQKEACFKLIYAYLGVGD